MHVLYYTYYHTFRLTLALIELETLESMRARFLLSSKKLKQDQKPNDAEARTSILININQKEYNSRAAALAEASGASFLNNH